jgi:xylulokinase
MEKMLVIDIGTTRLKVASVNEKGEIENIISKNLPKKTASEQNPKHWIEGAIELIKNLTEKEEDPKFCSIALTGNMHALLTVNKDGETLFDAWLWNDLRASKECEFLKKEYREEIKEKFFNPVIPGFPLPKLLYLKKNNPETFESIYKILQPKDFVAFHLCGEIFTDFTDASGTLMFNLKKRDWDREFLLDLNLNPSILPEVVPSYQKIGILRKEIAKATRLREGTPVVIGAGDLATASLGSNVDEDTLVFVLGTAGQILTVNRELSEILQNKIFAFLFADPEYYLYLGTVPAGGYSFEWFSKVLSEDIVEIFKRAESANPESKLLYLPFIQGTGTPHMRYEPLGAFLNISDEDSNPEFCRALVEGVVFALKESSDILENLSRKNKLVLQSLVSKIPLIQEILFSLYNRKKEIYLSNQKEASIIGGAVLGAVGAGIYDSISKAQENMVSMEKLEYTVKKGGEIKVLKRFDEYKRMVKILNMQEGDEE